MKSIRYAVLAAAIAAGLTWVAAPAGAHHSNGCGAFPTSDVAVQFGGDFNPAGQNYMNACTPAGSLYFYGSFGNLSGGDPSGMCGYLVADGAGPADQHVGLAGNWKNPATGGNGPNPVVLGPAGGDWPSNHDDLNCGIRG